MAMFFGQDIFPANCQLPAASCQWSVALQCLVATNFLGMVGANVLVSLHPSQLAPGDFCLIAIRIFLDNLL